MATSSTSAKGCSTTTRRLPTGAPAMCSWWRDRSEARPARAAARAPSTCAARSANGSIPSSGRSARSCEGLLSRGAAGASHEEDARRGAEGHVRLLPEVRRHCLVPALELPYDGGVAAVPFLLAGAMTPIEARAGYPILQRYAYLNAGSVGPLSRHTFEAMQVAEKAALENGRGGMSVWEAAAAKETAVRERIAALLRVPPETIALTTSTTEGCNLVITALRLTPDDEVVTTDGEHPGLLLPLLASGARIKQAGVMQRPIGDALATILSHVTSKTRLVALSHVLWLNGQVLPLADVKRATGLPLLVDGAQSVGAIPVDASVADWYTVSGQKWLCGPETTGALYVKEHDRLAPRIQSYAALARTDAARLALVHLAPAMVAGLLTAVEDFPEWGFDRAAKLVARCREKLLAAGVDVRTAPDQGTLLSFRMPGDPIEVVKAADARQIVIRNLPDGWLRASVGWWNDEADIDRLVAFLSSLA